MPRRAVTKRGDLPALANDLPVGSSNDKNAPSDTASSPPDTPVGEEGVLSAPFPSRKRREMPIIQSAAITAKNGDTPGPPGTLSLVAVPIGCMDDISLRGLRVLRESALILCENPAVSRSLTEHFGISTRLLRYGGQAAGRKNSAGKSGSGKNSVWLDRLLAGENLAFVCDAGTPCIADPGHSLVRAALQHSISVIALPGPAAALVALVASGLFTERFVFDGFPPRNRADRNVFFSRLAHEERTIVLYESAGALVSTLKALCNVLCADGNQERRVAVACRLTHPVENWFRGALQEALAHFRKHRPQGEYTLVIEGSKKV